MAKRTEKPGEMTGKSWLDIIGGSGNTGIQVIGTSPSFSGGGESIGPTGITGPSTNADLETIAKLEEWNELKKAYENGEATLRDLQNFDPGVLSSNETWMGQYNDFVTKESQAPQTWNKIEEILRRNGYSDDEIEDIKSSVKCLTGAGEVTCAGSDEKFRGSVILPGILGDLGYDGSWWDVRPDKGQPCTVYAENNDPLADQTADPNNPLGEYDADGNCVPLSSERQPGQPCPTAQGEGGIISANGDCETDFTQGVKCNATVDGVLVEGKRDANGDCVALDDGSGDEGADGETPDCTVVTQENAEECGYEITSDGQLIPVDLDDPNLPNYTPCGDNVFVQEGTECPDGAKTFQDYVNEVGEDVANTAKGIYEDFKDVITDCAGDPLECIKKIGDKILDAGISDKCKWEEGDKGGLWDCASADGTEEGGYCWKDCVNFNVLAGIPGFPSIPGMQDIGTYRDFEDFLKGIGKDIGEFIEDPAGTLEGWIKGIIDKIKGVFDSTADDASAVIDWLKGIFGAAVGAWVWGQIEEEVTNTILPNLQPYGMCPDGETAKTGPTNEGCPEPAVSCWDGTLVYKKEQCAEPPYGYCQDGTTVKSDASGTNCSEYAEFGYCEDGTTKKEDSAGTNCAEYTPDYGMCDDGLTKKENAEGTNCPGPEPEVNPGDPCDLENEQTGSYQYVGDELQCLPEPPEFGFCQDGVTEKADTDGTNCTEYAPNGYCQDGTTKKDNVEGTNCTEYSEFGYCQDGTTKKDNVEGTNCTEYVEPWENTGPTEEDCANQGKTFIPSDTESQTPSSCGDDIVLPWEDTGKTPEQCEAEGKLFIAGDPETQTPSSCGKCSNPEYIDYGNGCEPERKTEEEPEEETVELSECEKDPESYECLGQEEFCNRPENKDDKRCAPVVVEPPVEEPPVKEPPVEEGECNDCTCEEYRNDPANRLECLGTDLVECPEDTPNAGQLVTNLSECGTFTTFEPCDQQNRVENEDGSCGECKPGYTEDTEGFDQCIPAPADCNDCSCAEYATANPEECGTETTTPDPSADGGGGGGGGGGGMFDIKPITISADPQLLSRAEFPITDFLAGLFTGSGGGRA